MMLPPPPAGARQNHLLAALPDTDFNHLAQHLEPVSLRLGEMLYEPGQRLQHAYFPTTAVVSLHNVLASGAATESTGVGNEGVVGISLFLGGDSTPSSAVVQSAGQSYRLERRLLQQAFAQPGPLQQTLLRYTQALIAQISLSAACYRHHTVEQQLARWLLATCSRLPSHNLVMTQELVSGLLGVRRESITVAAGRLQTLGLISYRRGHISVLDMAGLVRCACECHGVLRAELLRLLPQRAQAVPS
jgi:CRP-like cAMP-binding protein